MKAFILILMILSIQVEAVPVFNATCAKSNKVKAPANGAGVYFNEDCSLAYVLPPAKGEVRIEAIAKLATLNQCETLKNYQITHNELSRRVAEAVRTPAKAPGGSGSVLFPAPGSESPAPPMSSDEALAELDKLRESLNRTYETLKTFWELPAATAQVSYTVGHQKLVDEYQSLNPQIVFRPITLREARIVLARVIGKGETLGLFPGEIPGATGGVDAAGVLAGESQSGQMLLSLMGACPYYDARAESMPTKLNARDLSAHMVANVAYAYELLNTRKYTAKYNLASFIRRLQTSESKGGFFSSKTVNRLIVEENTKDWFEIEMEAEDGRIVYDKDFAQLIKAQLIDRALRNIALFIQGAPIEAPKPTQPGANGASVAAGELRKCPYIYCQGGAAVLDVANAIFGKSTSVAEFIRKNDHWVTESSSERIPLSFTGTVDFKP